MSKGGTMREFGKVKSEIVFFFNSLIRGEVLDKTTSYEIYIIMEINLKIPSALFKQSMFKFQQRNRIYDIGISKNWITSY